MVKLSGRSSLLLWTVNLDLCSAGLVLSKVIVIAPTIYLVFTKRLNSGAKVVSRKGVYCKPSVATVLRD